MMQLANYLEEIENEKVTGGLYTMGVPYSKEKLKETIRLMFVDALAYNLAEVDIVKNKITREQIENKSFFNQKYSHPCEAYIDEIFQLGNTNSLLNRLISREDYLRATAWKQRKEPTPQRRMGHKKHKTKGENDNLVTDEERKQVRKLIIQLLPDPEKIAFIGKLNSDKEYERAMSLLDPQKRASIQRMAKFIPAMARVLATAADSSVNHVLKLIKKEELRALALKYLDDEGLEEEVALEKQRQDQELVSKALSPEYLSLTTIDATTFSEEQLFGLDQVKAKLQFYKKKKAQLIELLKPEEEKQNQLLSFIENNLDSVSNKLDKQIAKFETVEENFASAIFQVENTINSIQEKKQNLHKSPEYEMLAILNSLKGGYTAPSSGRRSYSQSRYHSNGKKLVCH